MEVIWFSKHQHIQKQAKKMSSLLLTFSHNGKFPLFTLLHDGYLRAFSRQTCAFGSLGFPSSLSRRRRRCHHRCLKSLLKDKSRLWNSVELYHQYQLFGRKALLQRSLLVKNQHHFLDDIAVLSSPGLSSLVVFRQNASTILHLTGDTEDDTQDLLIGKLAKIICDFHTGDAQYHVNSMPSFVSPRSISAAIINNFSFPRIFNPK